MLTNDPGMGVIRHVDAGYDIAEPVAAERGVPCPCGRPDHVAPGGSQMGGAGWPPPAHRPPWRPGRLQDRGHEAVVVARDGLDRQAATCWREALLAQAVLAGRTTGYRSHPQLRRFQEAAAPLEAVGAYRRGSRTRPTPGATGTTAAASTARRLHLLRRPGPSC